MKFSHAWLESLLTKPLPSSAAVAEALTFHSSEVEEVLTIGTDTMLEVKVLPDKSAWLLSHRGLARELSVILDNPLREDPYVQPVLPAMAPEKIALSLNTNTCDFYSAALISGVTVGPSPDWLVARLATIGQRSINNIVDITNYVMFELGQPLHAFDAGKLGSKSQYAIAVRTAREGEEIVTLTGETYTLGTTDMVIVDATTDTPIGIAGVKGGQVAAVDQGTTTILLEAAHFDRFAIRKTTKQLRLQTDASKRYENGISPTVAPIALRRAVALICELTEGKVEAVGMVGDATVVPKPVTVSVAHLNSVLGLTLTTKAVANIFDRFGYPYVLTEDSITVTPPFERDDIRLAEDLIEEVGRIHGLHTIQSIPPQVSPLAEYNARFYYAEKIRSALVSLGFAEVYTSSFRHHDLVKLENALATDKGYLRSSLVENLKEARSSNIPHRDLLGLSAVQIFEIGTVFSQVGEACHVAIAVQTGTTYKAKVDELHVEAAIQAITEALGISPVIIYKQEGILEFSLDHCLEKTAPVTAYDQMPDMLPIRYKSFSVYPSVSRDIAMWVPVGTVGEAVAALLAKEGGALCVRSSHIDTFSKDNRQSMAFRLVFQSREKTLTEDEIQSVMNHLYSVVTNQGWEAR